ncbi:MAG TPA: hypothetical protein VLT33_40305, partial [Labilithrix sp.]|nr:hypothetical protein [Labilithrix sp.]
MRRRSLFALALVTTFASTGCAATASNDPPADLADDPASATGGGGHEGSADPGAKDNAAGGGAAAPSGSAPRSPSAPIGVVGAAPAAPIGVRAPPHADEATGAPQADGFTSFVLAARNAAPIVLRTLTKNVKTLANGFSVSGDLTLETQLGPITLARGSLVLEWAADHADGIKTLRGDVDVPFPKVGAMAGFVDSPVHASIGWDLGANITATDLPINADRPYLFFDVSAGFSAAAGPISFAAPGGKAGRIYIDPTDPSIYLDGDLLGLGDIGPLSGMGVGLSARGLLPFTPVSTWGIENKVGNLHGHVYARGTVTLSRYPISIDGELFANVDPDGDGRSLFNGQSSGFEMGANGTLNVESDFLKFFTFKFPVAKATLGARFTAAEKYAYFSGVADPDDKWLPTVLPLRLGGR